PRPISVNMFGARCTIEFQARSKNGQPPHSTTGVASASSIQFFMGLFTTWPAGVMSTIAKIITRKAGPRLIQNRLDISRSSGFGRSSNVTILGSKAIPQIGQAPGSVDTTSGSIGQMYSTLEPGGARVGVVMRWSGGIRNAAGSWRNLAKQPAEQK